MIKRIYSKKIVFPDGVKAGFVDVEDGVIVSVNDESKTFDASVDYGDNYLIPGFFDIHTHGAAGVDYCDGSPEQIIEAVKFQVAHGATSILPTISSSSYESMYFALENLEKAMQDKEYGRCIVGAHLEGPYFSLKQCGAQDTVYITEPKPEDYERLIERFGAIIKRWDYAPERDEGGKFCAYLREHGIQPSAGHTDAQYKDMCVAREKGCNLITHLYSCTSTIVREQGFRKLGVTECAYLWDDMYVEIIADGKHLPIELLQLIFKIKPHDKIILITDSLRLAGSTENSGAMGHVQYIIEDGVCKLLDRSAFAGSIATADRTLRVSLEAGLEVCEAIMMGAETPSRLFGLNRGRIEVGYDADLVVMNDEFFVVESLIGGKKA